MPETTAVTITFLMQQVTQRKTLGPCWHYKADPNKVPASPTEQYVSSDAGLAGLGHGIFALYNYSCLSNSFNLCACYFMGGDIVTSTLRGKDSQRIWGLA